MNNNHPRKFFEIRYRLETGFSMLEAVVVVGVLLALAVGGFFAYGPIAENAKRAKVKSAASEVHTAVLVADIDGDPTTNPQNVIDDWNGSTDKIRVEILEPIVIPAMSTTENYRSDNGDYCVQATNVASPHITSRVGFCENVPGGSGSDDTNPENGGTVPDTDTDNDGTPDSTDTDIDGDGTTNASDDDIDGDGTLNAGDTTAYGSGSYSGPSTTHLSVSAPASLTTDPNVVIETVSYDANSMDVNFNLKINVGPGGRVGIIYHVQSRITCSLPDGSQFYKLNHWDSYYRNDSPTSQTLTASCPQNAGITTAVGYVAGAAGAHPGLIQGSSYRGPSNLVTGGQDESLRGHDASVAAPAGSNIDSRVLLRNVRFKNSSIDVGLAIENGNASQSGNIYGLQVRITCQLSDGSQYYKHGVVQTSYKSSDYPAPVFNFACLEGSTARGYIVGPDGGDPALNSSIGYRGPRNVMRGGIISPLEGNTPSTVAANQAYSNQRVSIRTLTYSGNNANIGVNINVGGSSGSGGIYSVSYRLTCKTPSTGAISYKLNAIDAGYSPGMPVANFGVSCNVGDEVIGAIAGPYAGHPALTSGSSYGGPTNYAVVGQE